MKRTNLTEQYSLKSIEWGCSFLSLTKLIIVDFKANFLFIFVHLSQNYIAIKVKAANETILLICFLTDVPF